MARIRILLAGVQGMLNDIVRAAIAQEPDLAIVEAGPALPNDLGAWTRRRRVDVIIYPAGDARLSTDQVDALLRANPRLGLVAIDGGQDRGTLHRLIPVHDVFTGLAHSSLVDAVRAGAALRLQAGVR